MIRVVVVILLVVVMMRLMRKFMLVVEHVPRVPICTIHHARLSLPEHVEMMCIALRRGTGGRRRVRAIKIPRRDTWRRSSCQVFRVLLKVELLPASSTVMPEGPICHLLRQY